MHPLVNLARTTVELYIAHQQKPSHAFLEELLTEYPEPASCFVTIYNQGQLRGCIGTIKPKEKCLVFEVIENAIKSATQDSRFSAINKSELTQLTYSIDLIGAIEEVSDTTALNPKTYGIIVEKGDKRGLLLPDISGIDTVIDQLRIARAKAGIGEKEEAKVFSFKVKRLT